MLISPAYAQAAGAPGAFDIVSLLPLVLIFVVFYFLLIRPQQQKMRAHRAMIEAIKKGDQIVTGGGIYGRVTKVEAAENAVQVEIAPNVQVRVARHTISDVLTKPSPGASNENAPAASSAASGSLLSRLFKK